MSDGTYRGRWVDEVFRSSALSAEVKVFLLYLDRYGYVSDAGRISEPRENLAAAIGCHSRKVTAKFAAAISVGLMRQVSRGQKHQTAVYQVLVPGVLEPAQGASTRHPERSQQAGTRHPDANSQGDKNRHPENAQGASVRHPEGVSGCQQPAPHIYAPPERGDDVEDVVVVPLFEEQIPFGRTNKSAKRDKPEPRPQDARDLFGEFWKAYPKHVARGAARTAWDKAIKNGADPEEVILGARAYASSPRRRDSDSKFTAHPATWLNHERWADEPEPAPSAAPGRTTNQHHESRAGAQLAEVFN